MQGRSLLPLLDRRTDGWRNETYFEMSEFMTGRGLRAPQYAYPHLLVNQAGNQNCAEVSRGLRQRLAERIFEASGAHAAIEPAIFPYP